MRNYENYMQDRIQNLAVGTQKQVKMILKNFDLFCISSYDKTRDEIISYVKEISDEEEREEEIVSIIQDWINKLSNKDKVNHKTIRVYTSTLNKYLRYYKIKIEFKGEIEWPQKFEEERYAISINEILEIFKVAKWKKQGYYLSLISSGARPIEIVGLRKQDYSWTGTRWWHKYVQGIADHVEFQKGRISFSDENGNRTKHCASYDSAWIVFKKQEK